LLVVILIQILVLVLLPLLLLWIQHHHLLPHLCSHTTEPKLELRSSDKRPMKHLLFLCSNIPKGSKLDIRLALQNRAEPNLVSQTPQNKKPREEQKKHSPFLTLFVFFFFSHLFLSGFSFSFKIIFKTIFKLWFKSI
jgi:hypothetical protein